MKRQWSSRGSILIIGPSRPFTLQSGEQKQVDLTISPPPSPPFHLSDSNPECHSSTDQRLQETLISKQWPLFIPVILTLLDDTTTRIRSRGLVILDDFSTKFPNNILRDTGLASVFEDAVFPTLHFLPNITPEAESIQLLVPAYSALLTLAGKVDGKPKTGKHHSDTPRAKLLDKILREGIFSAYFHAKEHIHIVEVLLDQTARVLKEMGVYAVKHLKVSQPNSFQKWKEEMDRERLIFHARFAPELL